MHLPGTLTKVREETIESFLAQLADRIPAPGGGASAALHAAQAAALLAMVARYSDGPRYDAALMGRIVAEADSLRDHALRFAVADADAFGAVGRRGPGDNRPAAPPRRTGRRSGNDWLGEHAAVDGDQGGALLIAQPLIGTDRVLGRRELAGGGIASSTAGGVS
jgi:Formiminotransferase-cyclodeaminase